MARLKEGESYLVLLPLVLLLTLLLSALFSVLFGLGLYAFPFMIVCLVVYQVWSGVALDSWWKAAYPKGTSGYRLILIWEIAVALFITIVWSQIE